MVAVFPRSFGLICFSVLSPVPPFAASACMETQDELCLEAVNDSFTAILMPKTIVFLVAWY